MQLQFGHRNACSDYQVPGSAEWDSILPYLKDYMRHQLYLPVVQLLSWTQHGHCYGVGTKVRS